MSDRNLFTDENKLDYASKIVEISPTQNKIDL